MLTGTRTLRLDSSRSGRSGNGHDIEEGEDLKETRSAKIIQRMNLVMIFFRLNLCYQCALITVRYDRASNVFGPCGHHVSFGITIAPQIQRSSSQRMSFSAGS
jgi:hypothetical protein